MTNTNAITDSTPQTDEADMTKTIDTTLVLQRISIYRVASSGFTYSKPDAASPFKCTIEVAGANGKVELNLSDDLSRRIVEIIADEVAAAGRATADIMTADALLVTPSKVLATGQQVSA